MKCPNGKHDSYCAEEDSVMDFSADDPVQECAQCVMEERNKLRRELAEARDELARAERTIKRMAVGERVETVQTIAEIHRQGVFERTGNPTPWLPDDDAEWDNPPPETLEKKIIAAQEAGEGD